jgi:hypothetical protein
MCNVARALWYHILRFTLLFTVAGILTSSVFFFGGFPPAYVKYGYSPVLLHMVCALFARMLMFLPMVTHHERCTRLDPKPDSHFPFFGRSFLP